MSVEIERAQRASDLTQQVRLVNEQVRGDPISECRIGQQPSSSPRSSGPAHHQCSEVATACACSFIIVSCHDIRIDMPATYPKASSSRISAALRCKSGNLCNTHAGRCRERRRGMHRRRPRGRAPLHCMLTHLLPSPSSLGRSMHVVPPSTSSQATCAPCTRLPCQTTSKAFAAVQMARFGSFLPLRVDIHRTEDLRHSRK
jgi:hypothetical protein